MTRANYLGAPAAFNLSQACRILVEAYGYHIYLVGSCLVKRDYRDVDVRCILDDDEFDAMFPGISETWYVDARWSIQNVALSEWLAARTGLPIDFQFQRRTQANEDFDGDRQPLGIFVRPKDSE